MEYAFFDLMRQEEMDRVRFEQTPTVEELAAKIRERSERGNYRPGRLTLIPIQAPTPHGD